MHLKPVTKFILNVTLHGLQERKQKLQKMVNALEKLKNKIFQFNNFRFDLHCASTRKHEYLEGHTDVGAGITSLIEMCPPILLWKWIKRCFLASLFCPEATRTTPQSTKSKKLLGEDPHTPVLF